MMSLVMWCVVLFKQKTAYERRISDWSSDVCSSDLDVAERDLVIDVAEDVVVLERALESAGGLADQCMGRREEYDLLVTGQSGGDLEFGQRRFAGARSEERRVGKACVSTWRSRW